MQNFVSCGLMELPVDKAIVPLTLWQEDIIETCLINVQKFIHLKIRRYTYILQQSRHRNGLQDTVKHDAVYVKVIRKLDN
jgi:hypothetical protein